MKKCQSNWRSLFIELILQIFIKERLFISTIEFCMLEKNENWINISIINDLVDAEIDCTRWKLRGAVNWRECRYISQAKTIKKCMVEIYFGEMIDEVLTHEFLERLGDLMDLYYRISNGWDKSLVRKYINERESLKNCLHKNKQGWYKHLNWICKTLTLEQTIELSNNLDNKFIDKLLSELDLVD